MKELNYAYTTDGAKGRPLSMSIGEVQNYSYGYDTCGRLNQIATPAGAFVYTRLTDSDLLNKLTRPNGVNTTWSYEPHRKMKMYLDGDRDFSSICGTGTEDYFCGAGNFGMRHIQLSVFRPALWRRSGKSRNAPRNVPLSSRGSRLVSYQLQGRDPGARLAKRRAFPAAAGRYLRNGLWYQREPNAPLPTLPDRNGLEVI